MRGKVLLALLVAALAGVGALGRETLLVYTYDSFASWGPAAYLEQAFEAAHDVDVQFVATGDSRAMLARMMAERDAGIRTADVFIGIEAADVARVRDLFVPLSVERLPSLAAIPEELRVDAGLSLVPYEHGWVTLVYDSEKVAEKDLPRTFGDLLDVRFRRSILLEDPRTSSPGLSFLLWTIEQYGDPGYLDYWRGLLPNTLTIVQGWSEAYSLFLAGEAPIVLSFSTDTAYGMIENGSSRYRVLLLNNGAYRTIYLAGVVRGTERSDLAEALVDLLLSREVQERIATSEWMFPANPDALLPIPFYQFAVVPPRSAMLDPETVAQGLDRWLRDWARMVVSP
jgi:thiamine transport system substrate-binding protein